jgi:hypothetical protein
MDLSIDNTILRNCTNREVAQYFKSIHKGLEVRAVFDHLSRCIQSESLPPRIFGIWILGFADDTSLPELMKYPHSRCVRAAATGRLGRRLRTRHFQDVWKAVGGPRSIVQLMTELSVWDVGHLCRVLGRSGTVKIAREERRDALSELVKALASDYFPESSLKNTETRPLLHLYAKVVPACTTDLVATWLAHDSLPELDITRLCMAHPAFMRQRMHEQLDSSDRLYSDYGSDLFQVYHSLFETLPPEPADDKISESTNFSLVVLRKLASGHAQRTPLLYGFEQLQTGLLKRLEKRTGTESMRAEALQNILQCLDISSGRHKDYMKFVIRLWRRDPKSFDYLLSGYLKGMACYHYKLYDLVPLLGECGGDKRLALLLLRRFLENHPKKINLDDFEHLKRFDEKWPSALFFHIPADDAINLLHKLERTQSTADYIDCRNVYDAALQLDSSGGSSMHVIVLSQHQQATERASSWVDNFQKKAMNSREQADRATYARAMLLCAAASRSVEILEKTLLWLRRFNRDPLTIKRIYDTSTIKSDVVVNLLSGMSTEHRKDDFDPSKTRQWVEHGNRVLLLLLETACMALREPSFHYPDWSAVIELFGQVTTRRVARAAHLQNAHSLDDGTVYELFCESTLSTLLRAESILLEEKNEGLTYNLVRGGDGWTSRWYLPFTSRPWVCRFVDELAQKRNALWEDVRRSQHPTVVTLQEPWCKGVPIQRLMPISAHLSLSESAKQRLDGDAMSYLMSRAECVVFSNPTAVLKSPPEDKQQRAAIGVFVDSYELALRMYVNCHSTKAPRNQRAQLAWEHAFSKLSEPSMTELEAFHFWQIIFKRADVTVPEASFEVPQRPLPILPDVDDPTEATEWNPDPDHEQWTTKSRELPETCLDLLLHPPRGFSPANTSEFSTTRSRTQDFHLYPFWNQYDNLKSLHPKSREAVIAASLLRIDSKGPSGLRILKDPFPSADDCRFPSLFLDDDFLDREDVQREFDYTILPAVKNDVPPTLLRTLCRALLDRISEKATSNYNLQQRTYNIIKDLMHSDKPELSLDLVAEVIVERPDDSSWHRHVFTQSLLRSLPSDRAKIFVRELTTRISEVMSEQAKRSGQPSTSETSNSPARFVKISTIKMIAQVLANADFVDEAFTFEILVELFRKSSHVDVRAAVVDSLVLMMMNTKQTAIQDGIVSALEQYAVPVAAALNERHPLNEDEWRKAEDDCVAPEVAKVKYGTTDSPILHALLTVADTASGALRESLFSRVLLPILYKSTANNTRWTSIFLHQHAPHIGLSATMLPAVPSNPVLYWRLLQDHTELVTTDILNQLGEASLANIRPIKELQLLNEIVSGSQELAKSANGRHWTNLWRNPGTIGLHYYGFSPLILLLNDLDSEVLHGITHRDIMKLFEAQAQAVILTGDETCRQQDELLHLLQPTFGQYEDYYQKWSRNCRPLVENLRALIEGMRTPQWQQDPNRTPAVLPDTYDLKLWLLPFPALPSSQTLGSTDRLDKFADALVQEIKTIAASAVPYHEYLEKLKFVALGGSHNDGCYIASKVGTMGGINSQQKPELEDLLRIELADALMREAQTPKKKHSVMAREMLRDWSASQHEWIRMKALRTIIAVSGRAQENARWVKRGKMN